MKNFKQIAEDCLAGKLSGIFVLQDGREVKSNYLKKLNQRENLIYSYSLGECWISDNGNAYGDTGYLYGASIKNFIPDMKTGQITINIPEGMEVIREETPGEIKIKFVEKKMTYDDIYDSLYADELEIQDQYCSSYSNDVTMNFHAKVEVLRKLTNIRNYFGKPGKNNKGWIIEQGGIRETIFESKYNVDVIVFAEREHAEEAIRILGDELKYLFERW